MYENTCSSIGIMHGQPQARVSLACGEKGFPFAPPFLSFSSFFMQPRSSRPLNSSSFPRRELLLLPRRQKRTQPLACCTAFQRGIFFASLAPSESRLAIICILWLYCACGFFLARSLARSLAPSTYYNFVLPLPLPPRSFPTRARPSL